MIALAAIAARRSGPTGDAPYRMPLYPAAPIMTLAALGYVTVTSWMDVEEGRPALIATGIQIAEAWAYYRLVLRRRGPWVVGG